MYRRIPKIDGYTRSEVLDFVREKLKNNIVWKKRALKVLSDFQTEDEKRYGISIEENNLGFDKIDSKVMLRIHRKVLKNQYITYPERQYLSKRLPRYAEQICSICDQDKLKSIIKSELKVIQQKFKF